MTQERRRILIQLNKLQAYRIPIFNRLARDHDLDVVVNNDEGWENVNFRIIKSKYIKIGNFSIQYWSGRPVNEYDAIFSILDMRNLTALWLVLRHDAIPYCIGYGHSFLYNIIRRWVFNKSRSILVYTQGMAQELIRSGVSGSRVHYAGNTVAVSDQKIVDHGRTTFLHVGTPKPRKQVEALFQAFSDAIPHLPNNATVTVVGPGAELAYGPLVQTLGLSSKVRFLGDVRDETQLANIFAQAVAYVAPGHVGLGALQAIGHGIPVVTRADREQGPEFEVCIDNYTARLYTTEDQLSAILIDLMANPKKARELGRAGRALYVSAYHPDSMAQRMAAAVETAIGVQSTPPLVGADSAKIHGAR